MGKNKKKEKVEEILDETSKEKVEEMMPKEKKLTPEEEDYKTQMLRIQAEFENYRKRTESEKVNYKTFYTSSVIEKIIPILDHFELAIKHECNDKNYSLGIEMIFNQFKQVLEMEGVKTIDIVGKKFDPDVAEVVSTKSDDLQDDEIVLETQMKGYVLGDKVIRRTRVIVNKTTSSKEVKE